MSKPECVSVIYLIFLILVHFVSIILPRKSRTREKYLNISGIELQEISKLHCRPFLQYFQFIILSQNNNICTNIGYSTRIPKQYFTLYNGKNLQNVPGILSMSTLFGIQKNSTSGTQKNFYHGKKLKLMDKNY